MGHTPGPWELIACDRGQKWAVIATNEVYPEHDRLVAFVGEDANARLIATAPLLLEALKAARPDLAAYSNSYGGHWLESLALVDGAIEAAEGRGEAGYFRLDSPIEAAEGS